MKATPFDHTATITLRHGDGTQSLYVLPSAHDVQRRHVCKQLYWTTQHDHVGAWRYTITLRLAVGSRCSVEHDRNSRRPLAFPAEAVSSENSCRRLGLLVHRDCPCIYHKLSAFYA